MYTTNVLQYQAVNHKVPLDSFFIDLRYTFITAHNHCDFFLALQVLMFTFDINKIVWK